LRTKEAEVLTTNVGYDVDGFDGDLIFYEISKMKEKKTIFEQ
jgi:hypothetical protein